MTWQITVLGYFIFGTISNLFRRYLAVKLPEHNRLVNASFFLIIYPIGLVVACFAPHNLAIGWQNFLFVFLGSMIFPIFNIVAYKGNELVDAGLFNIISNITPIVTIAVASLLLNESLSSSQIIGATIIIGSAFLATLPNLHHHMKANSRGLILSFLSFVILGVGIVFERWMLGRMDFGTYLVFGWGSQTFWMLVFVFKERKNIKLLTPKNIRRPILMYSSTKAIMGLSFVSSLKLSGNASLISSVTSFLSVIIVIAAYFFLGEKQHLWLKLTAALIGTAGLIIMYTS